MAKFDDFLSDPSFDDLDALDSREQLFALGGAVGKAKRKARRADRKQGRVDKRQGKVNKLRSEAEALLAKSKPKAKAETKTKTIPNEPSSPGLQGDGSNKKASTTVNKSKETKKPTVVKKAEVEKPKQSFGQAFSAARKAQGAGGTFMYNGKKYTTNRADDAKPKTKAKDKSSSSNSSSSKPTSSSSSTKSTKSTADNKEKKKKFIPKTVGQIKTEGVVANTKYDNYNLTNKKKRLKPTMKPDKTGKRFEGVSNMTINSDVNISKKQQDVGDFYTNSAASPKETTVAKTTKKKKTAKTGGAKKKLKRGGRTY